MSENTQRTAREVVSRSQADRDAQQQETAPRTRQASFGGLKLKMSVRGEIPGYHLYWENDEDGAIEQLLDEGFTFVTKQELYGENARTPSNVVADQEIDSRISRAVGKDGEGKSLRAYLLKCPDDVWADREAARHEMADKWDDDINHRLENPEQGFRKPNGVTSSINTRFRKAY